MLHKKLRELIHGAKVRVFIQKMKSSISIIELIEVFATPTLSFL